MFTDANKTEYKSTYQFLKDISEIWDELTDKQQANLLETIAGKRGAQALSGLLSDFSEVERAMEEMEGAAGAADREMSVIEESIDYKLNALKQTWVSILQGMIDRGDIGKVVDSLTTISESIGKLIPRLSTSVPLLSTLAGTLTAISAVKLGNFVSSLNMLGKFQTLSQIGSGIGGLGGIAGLPIFDENGNGIAASIGTYRKAIQGLSAENAALVLSTQNLTAAEAEAILTYNQGALAVNAKSDVEAQEIVTKMGLVSTNTVLNEEQIAQLTTQELLTKNTEEEVLAALGLTVAKDGNYVATKALNVEQLKELVTTGALTKEQYNLVIGITATTGAETAQVGVTEVLRGAWIKLLATISAHPLITLATAIAAVTVGLVTYTKKVKEARAETVKTAKADWEAANKTYRENGKTFDNLSKRYIELSKGVDSLGHNVRLTTDEYDEYRDVVNQIADLTPNLVQGWNEQGDAILKVKTNVELLGEAYDLTMRKANNQILSKGNDTIKSRKDEMWDWEHQRGAFKELDTIEKVSTLNKLINGNSIDFSSPTEAGYFDRYIREVFKEKGIDYSLKSFEDSSFHQDTNQYAKYLQSAFDDLSKEQRSIISGFKDERQAQLDEMFSATRDQFKAGISNELLDSEDLSDNIKTALSTWGDTIDNETLNTFETTSDMLAYIDDVVSQFEGLTDDQKTNFELGFTMNTDFNNGEITYDEYQTRIQDMLVLINQLFKGDQDKIRQFKILFGIEEEGDEPSVFANRIGELRFDDIAISLAKRQNVSKAGMPSDVEERMKQQGSEVADSWYHSLKKSEQEFVKNLSDEDLAEAVKFESPEEFDKWLEKLQSKAKIEVEADIKNADAVKGLNDLESNWSGLDTVYQSTVKTAGTADAKDIESVNSAMGGVSKAGDEDINVLTNALKAYNTALVENKGDTKAAQDAVDKLATAYVDQSDILENLTDENKDYYIEMLKNNGVTNAEEVVLSRLGVQAKKTSAALKELSKSLVNNYNIIKQGSEADGYSDAIGDVVSKTKSLLKVTDNSGIELFSADAVDDTFVLNNLDNIRAATEGDTEALNNLRLAIARVSASDVNTDINVPTDVAEAALDNLMDMVAKADAMDIEVGASIDDSQFLQALNQMVRSGQVSADAVAAAFQSMGYDAKWVNNTTKMSFVKTGANGMPSDVAEKMVNMPSLRITRQANAGGSSRVSFGGVPAGSTSGGDRGNSGGGDNNNSEETFDWIQITIQRIEEEIARLEEQVGNTYTEWINRNKALVKEMQKTIQEIDVQKVAAKAYLDEANKVELSEDYKKKVREGALNIETIKDNEDLVNAINKYQDAYNKYVQASDAVQTLTIRQGELAKQYFDMAKEEYQEQIDLVQTYADLVDKRLNRVQEQGYFASTKYYQQLSAFEEKNIATMKEQLNAMIARRNEAVASGKIKEGSTEWHNMGNEIMQVVNAIEEATTQLVTYGKEMRQLKWDVFDYTQSYTDQLTQEADFLIDLLDNQKLYEENGQFNARGWADAALHTSKYNVEMHKALLYAKERAKIEEESAKDPANKDLIERRQELLKLQQESITAAYAEKDAIKSLVEEGISLFLEQLQKVIDEYKEAQKDAKD